MIEEPAKPLAHPLRYLLRTIFILYGKLHGARIDAHRKYHGRPVELQPSRRLRAFRAADDARAFTTSRQPGARARGRGIDDSSSGFGLFGPLCRVCPRVRPKRNPTEAPHFMDFQGILFYATPIPNQGQDRHPCFGMGVL